MCQPYKQKVFSCDGASIALRRSTRIMRQDTLLAANLTNAYPSASLAERRKNGALNRKSPHLPVQLYREDHSMRTKQPIYHNLVGSAASFLFISINCAAAPHPIMFFCLENSMEHD